MRPHQRERDDRKDAGRAPGAVGERKPACQQPAADERHNRERQRAERSAKRRRRWQVIARYQHRDERLHRRPLQPKRPGRHRGENE